LNRERQPIEQEMDDEVIYKIIAAIPDTLTDVEVIRVNGVAADQLKQ